MIKCISISSEATDLEQMGHLKPGRRAERRALSEGRSHPPCIPGNPWGHGGHGSGQPLTCCLHGDPHPTQHLLGIRSSCAAHQQLPAWGQPPNRDSRRAGALAVPVPAAQRAWTACQGTAHVAISCCQALKGEQQPGARSTKPLAVHGHVPVPGQCCPCCQSSAPHG